MQSRPDRQVYEIDSKRRFYTISPYACEFPICEGMTVSSPQVVLCNRRCGIGVRRGSLISNLKPPYMRFVMELIYKKY